MFYCVEVIEAVALATAMAEKVVLGFLGQRVKVVAVESEATTTGSVQNSLQQMLLALSQISKIDWDSIQNSVEDDGFKHGVNGRYA